MNKMHKYFFRFASIFDVIAGLGLIFGLKMQLELFNLEEPNYKGMFTLVGLVTLLFAFVFYKLSNNPKNKELFQVAIGAKTAPFVGLTIAYLFNQLPFPFFLVGLITDGLWLIPFIYFYKKQF